MDKITAILETILFIIYAAAQSFGYWVNGVRIDFYASEQYRQEAVTLMNLDSTRMNEYRNETADLFEKRDFAGLSALIEKSQSATEAGTIPLPLWRDIDAFYGDDLDKEKLLGDWIEAEPDNWIPYAARAEYLVGEGWRARGGKYMSETSDEQKAAMRKAFIAAESDLQKALALKPKYSGVYEDYFELARHGIGKFSTMTLMDMAEEQGLGDYYLRYQYIETLQPKWGGGFPEIRAFALESQSAREVDPRVYQLLGYEHQIRGELASREKDWEACVQHYTKAFEYGDIYKWRYGRARCNENLKRWDAFIADLEIVGLQSRDDNAFSRIARAYANKKQYKKALINIEKAIQIEPDVAAHHNYAAWLYMAMRNDDQALNAFAKTLSILPNDVYAADNTARILLSRHKREAALPFLEISAHYDETNAQKWYLYADVLKELDKPEYRAALERFLEHVDRSDSRWTQRVSMVEAHLAGRGEFQ